MIRCMSALSDVLLALGGIILGAVVIDKVFSGSQANCNGTVNQTCIGPLCWSTCTSTPATTTPYVPPSGPGTFTGTTGTGTPCNDVGPLAWLFNPECWAGGTIGW